ncbi:MAG: hypothetical protein KJ621_03870 [Proteobacteria bacterium]|nr:hypothetical protein [Pseudomonadota bacterium]MBU1742175.1 hypothetical protein [Pseudomonadota bacterium]
MWEILIWIYIVNAALLMVHEMDSAYWREWEMFRLPGGAAGFLIIHLPLVIVLLWGLVLLARHTLAGQIFSLILAGLGVGAFVIHLTFLKLGRPEFKTPVSLAVLTATLLCSLAQGVLTVVSLVGSRPG